MKRILFYLNMIVCLGTLCWCGLPPAAAEEMRVLAVEEPPGSFVDETGKAAGFAVEVFQALQKRVRNSDPITFVPENRALKIARESPNVILFSFSRTLDREDDFYWIMLLMRKPWVLYAKKGFATAIMTLEAAKHVKSIGVVRGDVRALVLEQMGFLNLQEVSTHEQTVGMLQLGRIEMIFYEPQGMASVCSKMGVPMSSFEAVFETDPSEVYIMMSKQGTDVSTAERWQTAARDMKADFTFQRIAEKWAQLIKTRYAVDCEVANGALNF